MNETSDGPEKNCVKTYWLKAEWAQLWTPEHRLRAADTKLYLLLMSNHS